MASLPDGLDVQGALKCMNELPSTIEQHPGMAVVWDKAAELFAAHLGPVAGMFEEGEELVDDLTLALRDVVKQLSLSVFKRLLSSEALQLQLENEAYTLLCAWLWQSPHALGKEHALFKELAPLLRYHHMTADFVANVVATCYFMEESKLLPSVVRSALVQREANVGIIEKKEVERGRCDRGVGTSQASWGVEAPFTLEVAALGHNRRIKKWCGLVAGYPAALRVARDEGNMLGLYFNIDIAPTPTDLQGALSAGVALKVDWIFTPNIKTSFFNYFADGVYRAWGFGDIFRKPWAEAVREGSQHFPNGTLEIKATVKLAVKK